MKLLHAYRKRRAAQRAAAAAQPVEVDEQTREILADTDEVLADIAAVADDTETVAARELLRLNIAYYGRRELTWDEFADALEVWERRFYRTEFYARVYGCGC